LENLAEAESAVGDFEAAIAAMNAAIAKRRDMGSEVSVAWNVAHVSIWHARLGDLEIARTHIAKMLASEATIRIGNPWPQYCYWAAAQVYRLLAEAGIAARMLERAFELMMLQADRCPTPQRRANFLALAWHRDIAAARTGSWPPDPR
jgi:hypothetical protein